MTKLPNKFTFNSEYNSTSTFTATKQANGNYSCEADIDRNTQQPKNSNGHIFTASESDLQRHINTGRYQIVKSLDANGVDIYGKPLQFSYEDLKEGMRVKLEDGEMWIATKNVQGGKPLVLVNGNNGWDHFSTHFDRGDVAEIYANNEYNCYQHNPEKIGALIWRKVDAAKEAAKKELQEKITKAREELAALIEAEAKYL